MALTPVDDVFRLDLSPCILYLDDLREIVTALEAVGPAEVVVNGSHRADTVDDVLSLRIGSIRTLRMKNVAAFGVSVSLSRNGAELERFEHSPEAKATTETIRAIVDRQTRKLVVLFTSGYGMVIAGFLVLLGFGFFLFGMKYLPFDALWWPFLSLGLLFSGTLVGGFVPFWLSSERHVLIVPRTKASGQSFWQRNKDGLLMAILTGVIGIFLGVLGTIVTQAIVGH